MKIYVWMYSHVGVLVCNAYNLHVFYVWIVETFIPTNKQKHAHVHIYIYIYIYIYIHMQPWLILNTPSAHHFLRSEYEAICMDVFTCGWMCMHVIHTTFCMYGYVETYTHK